MKSTIGTLASAILTLGFAATASATTVDFSGGAAGWDGNAFVDATLGHDAPALHSQIETFGLSWRNDTNSAFVGNYTASSSITLGLDVLASSITFEGIDVSRELIVSLVDKGDPANGVPDAMVWYDLGTLSSANPDWTHYSVTLDTASTALPSGWGADDGEGDLVLPPGRTFNSVLANVDEISFSTYVPGYFYGYTDFDVAADNISINRDVTAVPEPASVLLLVAGLAWMGRRARGSRGRR
jgi:hypothetical protein